MDLIQPLEWDRRFQLWYYSVGHSQLLLRANPVAELDERIEVLFKSVDWISMPTVFDGLGIAQVGDEHGAAALEKHGAAGLALSPRARVFRVHAGAVQGLVVAGAVFSRSDRLDYAAPSPWGLPTP